jgi:phosphatidylglycerol---prolipoprotein diacylglyceryl transferase
MAVSSVSQRNDEVSFMPMRLFTALAFPNINPVALSIGPLSVHWYGIGYVVGIMFAWWWARKLVSKPALWPNDNPRITVADLDDFVVWITLGVVLGGRIGYILFYDFAAIAANPLRAFQIWKGGMSFHGGFLGSALAMFVFAKKRGLPVWGLLDVVTAGVPIGLGLVRVTNFINDELWGRASDVPWAVMFPSGGGIPRHPSQLYEAFLEGAVLFGVLCLFVFLGRKLKSPGFITGAFTAGYGISRIIVEFFRVPDAQLGYLAADWVTMGMILSLPMVLSGLWAMFLKRR